MVLGTARRLVNNAADADDVFQAVFLSLAKLAKSIRHGNTVPNWLYTTTCRIAARARKRRQDVALDNAPEPVTANTVDSNLIWRDLRAALDDELQRLPDRLRSPLLLCYLSGLSRDEAAQQLGWSLGTLKRRLEEGRAALRKRLELRGISAAGLALAVLSPAALDACVPPDRRNACLVAVSGREVSAGVSALILTTTNFKGIAMKAVIVMMALTGLGIGLYSSLGRADPSPAAEEKKPEEPKATAKRVHALGDPLPDGAIMRLGTRRFREDTDPWQARPVYWQDLPDGKSYLVRLHIENSSEIRRIDMKTGAVVETWRVPDEIVGFSRNGRYVLLANDYMRSGILVDAPKEWRMALYDLAERKPVWSTAKKLPPGDWPATGKCVFSAKDQWIVTGNYGNEVVHLWDARNGDQLWEYRSKGQSLAPVGFVDDDKTLVLRGDNDGDIHLIDRAKGTETKTFPTAQLRTWAQTVIAPDGRHLIICTSHPPTVWDLEGKKTAVLDHDKWANLAAFSPDGKKLYTGSHDTFVTEREWPSGQPIRKIELDRDKVQRMAVSADGKRLELVFEGEQAIIFYDLATGIQLPELVAGHRSTIYGIHCAADGALISYGRDRSIRTWDVRQGRSVGQFTVEMDLNGFGFALSADGKRIAVPNYDVKTIGIYERQTGKRLRNIEIGHFWPVDLAFSHDGRFLSAVATSFRSAQVFDALTGVKVLSVQGGAEGNVDAGGFSADGRTFAFADGRKLRTWDTATWKAGFEIDLPLDWGWVGALGLTYSPDDRTIALGREDGIKLFEVATRRERAHIKAPGSTTGLPTFSHNGRLLAWVNDYGKINVMNLHTGALAGPFTGHESGITGLAFTIDDKALASSSGDSTILVWNLSAKTSAKTLPKGSLHDDWQALRGEDAAKAFLAMQSLAAQPEAALKLASEHLKPAKVIDPQWLAARLRDLDSPKFAERERATRELEERGDGVASAVEKFLAGKPSAEASQRAEKVLATIRGRVPTDGLLQSLRALEVLEWIGTDKAFDLVEKLARGAEGAALTEAAKQTLKRRKSPME